MKHSIFVILALIFIVSCNNMTKSEYPAGNEIVLEWEFIGNKISEGYFSSVFTLRNSSSHTLGDSGWALYFNQMGLGVIQKSVTGNVRIEHINGDLVRITPEKGFQLNTGQAVEIGFDKPGRLIKENEAPLGPYMLYMDDEGKELISQTIQNYTIKPFPSLQKIYPAEASVPLPDAEWVYGQNQFLIRLKPENIGRIIPSPKKVSLSGEKIALQENLMIHYVEGLEKEAGYLSKMLKQVMGKAPAVMRVGEGGPDIIRLVKDRNIVKGEEAYQMSIDPDNGVVITGGDAGGVFYGIQSLLALIPWDAWATSQSTIELETLTINDHPAFFYRGLHLDIARNFQEPDAIKKLIQVMAFYKLNKLHLHLTDDEGWRLEIPSLPELTEIGAFRGHTSDNKDHLSPSFGSGADAHQGTGHGSGLLTAETFIELLQFADDHHIEVIPEINFPGHARAAIYAMEARYDRLMKEGKEEEALKYRLIDPEDTSQYNSAQNFDDNVICVCHEASYLFYETVVDALIKMYNDAGLKLNVMHTGGDEVPLGSWTGSPVCLEFLKNHPEVGGVENLQAYFEGRLFEILKRKNLVMAGWEEIAMRKNEVGQWIPNPEFAGNQILPYVWNSLGENLDLGNRLANAGFPVVLCNVSNFYFDLAYNHHPAEPGHYWGGFVNTRRAFEFIPYNVFNSTLTDRYLRAIDPDEASLGLENLRKEAYKNIVGIQGALWSEYVKGGEMLEYFYLPKMTGLAERAWAGQMEWGSIENHEKRIILMSEAWNEFANMVGQREMPRLDYLFNGFNYRLPPPGAMIQNGLLYANVDFPGLPIRFTEDGSEPGMGSNIYSGPVKVTGNVMLRSFDTRGRGSLVSVVEFK